MTQKPRSPASAFRATLAIALALGIYPSCGGVSGGGTDSNTHWLASCDTDNQCGGLACICGMCTSRCSSSEGCSPLSSKALCKVGARPACGAAPICVAACQSDDDCPRAMLVCVEGQCLPNASAGGGGSGGTDAGESNGGTVTGIGGTLGADASESGASAGSSSAGRGGTAVDSGSADQAVADGSSGLGGAGGITATGGTGGMAVERGGASTDASVGPVDGSGNGNTGGQNDAGMAESGADALSGTTCSPNPIQWIDTSTWCGGSSCVGFSPALTVTDIGVWAFVETPGYFILDAGGSSGLQPFDQLIDGASGPYAGVYSTGALYQLGTAPSLLTVAPPFTAMGAVSDGVFVAGEQSISGSTRAWLSKYSSTGAQLWTSGVPDNAGLTGEESGDVQSDGQGEALWAVQVVPTGGYRGTWLVKMTSAGVHDWTVARPDLLLFDNFVFSTHSSSPPGPGLAVNGAGESVLVGWSSNGHLDVTRYHSDGTKAWAWTDGGNWFVPSYARAVFDSNDNAYVAFWPDEEIGGVQDPLYLWKFSPSGEACLLSVGPYASVPSALGMAIQGSRLYVVASSRLGVVDLP